MNREEIKTVLYLVIVMALVFWIALQLGFYMGAETVKNEKPKYKLLSCHDPDNVQSKRVKLHGVDYWIKWGLWGPFRIEELENQENLTADELRAVIKESVCN